VKKPKKDSRLSFFTSFFIEKENDLVFYNYERQACVFKAGDLLRNFNGNDYRVMENYVVPIPVIVWQAKEQKEKGGRSLLGWIYRRKHLLELGGTHYEERIFHNHRHESLFR
jgi:hypothetical protein